MRKFNVGDRVTLPVGTTLRNTVTGEPSVWNSPGALTQPLTGTLLDSPECAPSCAHLGAWFRFGADPNSGSAHERARFDRFYYPEADLEPVPPDEWVSVGHAFPEVRPSDVGLPCSESDWVLIAVPGWDAPAVARFRRWVDNDGDFDSSEWVLQGRDSYIVSAPVTHWRKLPALPALPALPTR